MPPFLVYHTIVPPHINNRISCMIRVAHTHTKRGVNMGNKTEKWHGVKSAARALTIRVGAIRQLCRGTHKRYGGFEHATKTDTGAWVVPHTDIVAMRKHIKTVDAERIEQSLTGSGQRMRPTTASCRRIRKRVTDDKTLTPEQRQLFVQRIDAYETEWDNTYNKRQS